MKPKQSIFFGLCIQVKLKLFQDVRKKVAKKLTLKTTSPILETIHTVDENCYDLVRGSCYEI